MGMDLYVVDYYGNDVEYDIPRLVGHKDFLNILWECELETATISEYDCEYCWRPVDFRIFINNLEKNENIQLFHIELAKYMETHENVYVGFSN